VDGDDLGREFAADAEATDESLREHPHQRAGRERHSRVWAPPVPQHRDEMTTVIRPTAMPRTLFPTQREHC